ncbi:LacI family DNA-binding transcriptional regulator [Klugiella xanthotipulae]|uniref:LacI family transcriptional regulator n=1 Tax=Klugiella xanthotipulae TaxID=244735 RepID=A0A543HZ74_9MICO|nr:LacI family DNA-binding transcriptional regulator [Klugiella xanthotipulae]TQM63652.1 LacI family transcriptional regulator [Klugiella xanthotipulae]
MVTIADVAQRAGVSKATTSRALSGQGYVAQATRTAVQRAAEELGYIASANASGLATGRSQSIAVLIPIINRWFFAEVLQSVESALLAASYDMTVYNVSHNSANRERVFDYFLLRRSFDAVLLVGVDTRRSELDAVRRLGVPLACIGAPLPGIDSYVLDDYRTARSATEHLVTLGHRRISFFGGPAGHTHDTDPESSLVHGERFAGYRDAMIAAGLDEVLSYVPAQLTIASGLAAGRRRLAHPEHPLTAVMAESDEVACGVLLAARELGLDVPRDVSVIGIDGHDHGEAFGLTTMQQNPQQLGAMAVRDVLARIAGEGQPLAPTPVSAEFVVRSSTAAPRREDSVPRQARLTDTGGATRR